MSPSGTALNNANGVPTISVSVQTDPALMGMNGHIANTAAYLSNGHIQVKLCTTKIIVCRFFICSLSSQGNGTYNVNTAATSHSTATISRTNGGTVGGGYNHSHHAATLPHKSHILSTAFGGGQVTNMERLMFTMKTTMLMLILYSRTRPLPGLWRLILATSLILLPRPGAP